jgi:glycerol kinase
MSTYFSALKMKWLLENVPAVMRAVEENRCLLGTVDSWLLWVMWLTLDAMRNKIPCSSYPHRGNRLLFRT